jgi:glycosyltransferase involved in cell wall biosynthesis
MSDLASLISVIMPVRNAGSHFEEAVASILNQQNVSLELILVDDHSTDQAIKNLPKNITQDIRLKNFSSDDCGVVAAMEVGYAQAQGKFIARMDADDVSLPNRLFEQLNYLQQHPEIGIAGGKVKIISDSDIAEGFLLYEKWLNHLCHPEDIERELFIESPIPNPTAFFRREIYEQLNGYQDPDWAEDYDMWLRAHALGIKMGKPDNVILHWRDHERRLTHCDSRYDNKRFMQAKAYYLARSHHYLKHRKAIIWGTGPTGAYLHDILIEQNVEVEAFIEVDPKRIGGVKRGLPVLHFNEINEYTGKHDNSALIIGAVGARGARAEIRQALLDMGKEEGIDFLFAA